MTRARDGRVWLTASLLLGLLVLLGACGGLSGAPLTGTAALEGRVLDAVTGEPIPGATVTHVASSRSVQTDEQGRYAIGSLPEGDQKFRVSKEGYITVEETVRLRADETVTHNFVLSPVLASGEWRIVLSWGSEPPDLDSHLWTPGGAHVYYDNEGDCDADPYACLDRDDTDGEGPETITITRREGGTYKYAVVWYSDSADVRTWPESGAVVRVYNGDRFLGEFKAEALASDDVYETGRRCWYVFDISADGSVVARGQLLLHGPGGNVSDDPCDWDSAP